jgi:hypothetical protein
MGSEKPVTIIIAICIFILFSGLNSNQQPTDNTDEIVYTGCTPGDQYIKSVFNIPEDVKVDFIRWNLTLKDQKFFILKLVYGVAKPNTLGFINGGKTLTLEGEYSVSKDVKDNVKRTIYWLKSDNGYSSFEMVKINENLFHLLTPENKLMVGNGGWSYTLNRKEPVPSDELQAIIFSSEILLDTARQTIYEGRTPCVEIARDANIDIPVDCFKLKWKLILNRDPSTQAATTYQLSRTNSSQSDQKKGTWTIKIGTPANADAVIYKLDPDIPDKSISFLVADENIIFFLDKNYRLLTGNQDFSYTLNRKFN